MTSRTGNSHHTPGPWLVATSCSWRRIVSRDHGPVCEPIVQHPDNHPDLFFRNGGEDGPDACLIAASPDLFDALSAIIKGRYLCLDPSGRVWHDKGVKALEKAMGK